MLLLLACAARQQSMSELDASARVALVSGFSGPEAVRYDPDQDVYFVANFNGDGDAADGNGFISRVTPEGQIDNLRFIEGGSNGVTLHAPRGMTIVGDTLWACDVGAVRGFDRRTGAPLATVDFSGHDSGFLNDIAPGADGALYVTDTVRNRIYRLVGGSVDGVTENETLGAPNGITWSASERVFIVVPYGGGSDILAYDPGSGSVRTYANGSGARYDGVEILADGAILVASQADTSLHVFRDGTDNRLVRTAGRPADIGVDTRRMRVAVPFIALNSIEILQLPTR
jgi:sugar lactone lactonase YvrE